MGGGFGGSGANMGGGQGGQGGAMGGSGSGMVCITEHFYSCTPEIAELCYAFLPHKHPLRFIILSVIGLLH